MDLDPVLIARLQFAFTIIFHIIFPAFTIGLSAYIATLCVIWMRTGKEHYRLLARLPPAEYQRLAPHLQGVALEHKQIIYRAFAAIDW